jgi:integrase
MTWEDASLKWLSETSYKKDHNNDVSKVAVMDEFFYGLRLKDITRARIHDFMDAMSERTSPSTANHYGALLSAVLNRAVKVWEVLEGCPKVEMFHVQNRRIRIITPQQRAALINALPPHQRPWVEFALETGLRQHNVMALRWSHVDLERGMAWIDADEAKAAAPIGVPLTRRAVEIIAAEQGKHPTFVFTFPKPVGHGATLNVPVHNPNTRAFRRALEIAGMSGYRWHDLRHAWASAHVMSGTTLAELKELGGWKSDAMVSRYAHLSPDHLREAAEKADAYWSKTATVSATVAKNEAPAIKAGAVNKVARGGIEPPTRGFSVRKAA